MKTTFRHLLPCLTLLLGGCSATNLFSPTKLNLEKEDGKTLGAICQ